MLHLNISSNAFHLLLFSISLSCPQLCVQKLRILIEDSDQNCEPSVNACSVSFSHCLHVSESPFWSCRWSPCRPPSRITRRQPQCYNRELASVICSFYSLRSFSKVSSKRAILFQDMHIKQS